MASPRYERENPRARARTPSHEREEQDQNEEKLPSTRTEKREKQDENEEQDQDGEKELPSTRARAEPPMYVSFITRVCKYLDHRSPVGGATLAHWSGEKGGREPPWIQTFAYTVQPFP